AFLAIAKSSSLSSGNRCFAR
ncbi:hypothetical protein CCACVL1_00656, partial [Corchorus capsularis]